MKISKNSLIAKIKHHYSGFEIFKGKLRDTVDKVEADELTDIEMSSVQIALKNMREEIEKIEEYANGYGVIKRSVVVPDVAVSRSSQITKKIMMCHTDFHPAKIKHTGTGVMSSEFEMSLETAIELRRQLDEQIKLAVEDGQP